MIAPASRTPEGQPLHCGVCGGRVEIEVSQPAGDATCPRCGSLLWGTWQISPAKLLVEAIEEESQATRIAAAEIAGLALSDLSFAELFPIFLTSVVAALGAAGGRVWEVGSGKEPQTLAGVGQFLHLGLADAARHRELLGVALQSSPLVVPPGTILGMAANPTVFLLLFTRLDRAGGPPLLIEILQRPGANSIAQRATCASSDK